MKFILDRAKETFLRFPETLLIATGCAAIAITINHWPAPHDVLMVYLQTLSLGIPLSFSIAMLAESHDDKKRIIRMLGLILCTAFLLAFERSYNSSYTTLYWIRFCQFNAGFHLFVAFAPFIGRGTTQGFWQFNRLLFVRFIMSAIYTGTLCAGLAIALWAIDSLLNVKINAKVYSDLFLFLSFVFNTWFFLSGVPDDIDTLDTDTRYPNEIRVFTQYVLLPLVTLYFVILYLYMGKIIGLRDWPKGTIGYLVSSAAILGIFSLLLIHPLQDSADHRWVQRFSKYFYIALFPLIVLLVWAVWKRTDAYGLTERRYFLFVIAGWLMFVASWFTWTRNRNIRIIPATLCVLCFLTAVGPWSAFNISRHWQKSRLESLLRDVGAFNGKTVSKAKGASFEQEKNISGALDYLQRMHGYKTIQPLFSESITEKSSADIMEMLGLRYVNPWKRETENAPFYWNAEFRKIEEVKGYDWSVHFQMIKDNNRGDLFFASGSAVSGLPNFKITVAKDFSQMTVQKENDPAITFPTLPVIENIRKSYEDDRWNVPRALMTLSHEGQQKRIKVIFQAINGARNSRGSSDTLSLASVEGTLLYGSNEK